MFFVFLCSRCPQNTNFPASFEVFIPFPSETPWFEILMFRILLFSPQFHSCMFSFSLLLFRSFFRQISFLSFSKFLSYFVVAYLFCASVLNFNIPLSDLACLKLICFVLVFLMCFWLLFWKNHELQQNVFHKPFFSQMSKVSVFCSCRLVLCLLICCCCWFVVVFVVVIVVVVDDVVVVVDLLLLICCWWYVVDDMLLICYIVVDVLLLLFLL